MLFMDNLARVRGISLRQQYEESHDDIDWAVVERFSTSLRLYKGDQHLVDYTDLLERFVLENRPPRISHLLVDEAQDLSHLQWEVIATLSRHAEEVWVAGDDDQAIFRWAGADVDTIVDLEGDVSVLGQSYRVPRKVQAAASEIIQQVRKRRTKVWSPRDDDGIVRSLSDLSQVDWTGDSVMILARNQYLLTGVMNELRSSGVLYMHHGHPSVKQSLLDAIVSWETLRNGTAITAERVVRVYDFMGVGTGIRRGFKKLPAFNKEDLVTINDLKDKGGLMVDTIWHQAMDKIPLEERVYMVRCRKNGERFSIPPRVRVDTIHASKGGEADRVVLMTDMAQRTYMEYAENPDDEARVFYVGATRAKKELCIVAPRSNRYYPI